MKFIRLALIASGLLAFLSAVLNIYTAYQMIGPTEEASLGMSRSEIVIPYYALLATSMVLLYFGFRAPSKPTNPPRLD